MGKPIFENRKGMGEKSDPFLVLHHFGSAFLADALSMIQCDVLFRVSEANLKDYSPYFWSSWLPTPGWLKFRHSLNDTESL